MDRARCGLGLPSKEDLFRVCRRWFSCGRVQSDATTQNMVPNSRGVVVAEYGDNVYSGQFSAGEFFFLESSTILNNSPV
jgi:hypothetical protein